MSFLRSYDQIFVKIYGIPEIREAKQNNHSYLFNAHNPEGTHRQWSIKLSLKLLLYARGSLVGI